MKLDLTGMTTGELTILRLDKNSTAKHPRWWCLCSCGTTKSIGKANLVKGQYRSCGCLYRLNVAGQRFGSLTAIHTVDRNIATNKFPHTMWKCLCDCGEYSTVRVTHLTTGHTKSCGCIGGGFRSSDSARLYIMKTTKFVGLGITGNITRRINEHRKALAAHGIKELGITYYNFRSGLTARNVERELKTRLTKFRKPMLIPGFKEEAFKNSSISTITSLLTNRRTYPYGM